MFDDNSYEPIAEINVILDNGEDSEGIYCLCSRVFFNTSLIDKEDFSDIRDGYIVANNDGTDALGISENIDLNLIHTPESTLITHHKKNNEESDSCYHSAPHHSTDDQESFGDNSDREADWERYWSVHGEKLIWESWISNYGSYIDPSYVQQPTDGEENLVDTANAESCDKIDSSNNKLSKYESICNPKILVDEIVYGVPKIQDVNEESRFTNRRSSNISETAKSNSEKSDDSTNLEDLKSRLNVFSGRSGSSALLSDSMTNVSKITLSSSDSNDVSAASSASILSLSDSGSSADQQWRLLWTEHFNKQYDLHYKDFADAYCKKYVNEDTIRSESGLILQGDKESFCVHSHSQHQELIDAKSGEEQIQSGDEQVQSESELLFEGDKESSCVQRDLQHQELFGTKIGKEQVPSESDSLFEGDRESSCVQRDSQQQELIDAKSGEEQVQSESKLLSEGDKELSCIESNLQHELIDAKSGEGKVQSESELLSEGDKESSSVQSDPQQELIDAKSEKQVPSTETLELPVVHTSTGSNSNYIDSKRLSSVGYLLNRLQAMSLEPNENMEDVDAFNEKGNEECAVIKNDSRSLQDDTEECSKEDDDPIILNDSLIESDSDKATDGRGTKRSHENEREEPSVEKIKSAYQLLGLMHDTASFTKIRKGSVWYKKRFNQIRFQNRILRIQKQNHHIYFNDDGDICNKDQNEAEKISSDDIGSHEPDTEGTTYNRCDKGEVFVDAEESTNHLLSGSSQEHLRLEDSEKNYSSESDDEDIFLSAEEDVSLELSQETGSRCVRKRKKTKKLKKKASTFYPEEILANPKIKKYWRRRYSLFSKFDEGIKMDEESWYSVTPEKIAINIAERCCCDLVVDAFCGAGGNAIQLAFTCERVIAIDIDPHKIELARNNARVYGVEDRIEFVCGDFLALAPSLTADVVFLSPPWGGVGYKRDAFPLSALLPVDGRRLLELASAVSENVAFFLPRNVNTHELVECAGPGGSVEIVQNFLDRDLVAVTAYFGELVNTIE